MRSGQVEKDHVDQDFCAHLVLKSLPIANDLGLGHLRAKERLAYTLVPIGLSLQLAGGGSTGASRRRVRSYGTGVERCATDLRQRPAAESKRSIPRRVCRAFRGTFGPRISTADQHLTFVVARTRDLKRIYYGTP